MDNSSPEAKQQQQQFGRVDAKELLAFVDRCMRAAGCPAEHAAVVAEVLVAADLRGVHSHGVNRLEMYVGEIKKGEVDPLVRPTIVNETPAVACVDGQNGLGMVIGRYCMDVAIKKAKEMGIGWVVTRGSNHYGIAGYYAMMALQEGMVGMSYTNTSPISFPTRSSRHVLGTNPIAVAAPSSEPSGALPHRTCLCAFLTPVLLLLLLMPQTHLFSIWPPQPWLWVRLRYVIARAASVLLVGEVRLFSPPPGRGRELLSPLCCGRFGGKLASHLLNNSSPCSGQGRTSNNRSEGDIERRRSLISWW